FAEGTNPATFTHNSGGEVGTTSTEVVVQDWLIIGIGDSNGSGEGTPDIRRSGTTAAVWVDQRCDRSGNSYQARSARLLEKTSKSTSVTFVHLACSGAEIDTGLLKGYEGIIAAKPDLAPQMRKVKRIAKKREVDALIVSIGVNDLKFGAMVVKCIDQIACWTRADVAGGSGSTLDDGMKKRLAELPRLYARLAKKIDRAGIEPDRVYITQYFDSTKDQTGTTCSPLIRVGAGSLSVDFDQAEAQWAHDSVLAPLNAAVRAAAEKHGWTLVGGSPELFADHGYCSNDSWIVSLAQSLSRQGDQNGTLHSTRKGNDAQAGLVVPIVRSDFFAQQKIRPPREP
ncbi:MAG: GDSL-type esterase/lipase family protein, partial [Acidimicrobiales bacterium]